MKARRVRASRVVTLFAVGFLALDAILLVLAGVWANRFGLVMLGALFGFGAMAVVMSWRRYQKRIQEINEALANREMEFLAMQREFGQRQD